MCARAHRAWGEGRWRQRRAEGWGPPRAAVVAAERGGAFPPTGWGDVERWAAAGAAGLAAAGLRARPPSPQLLESARGSTPVQSPPGAVLVGGVSYSRRLTFVKAALAVRRAFKRVAPTRKCGVDGGSGYGRLLQEPLAAPAQGRSLAVGFALPREGPEGAGRPPVPRGTQLNWTN